MYVSFRLFSHGFHPLKFWLLPAGIIGRYGEKMEWDRLLDDSRRFGMERLVVFVLTVLKDLFGAEIPPASLGHDLLLYRPLKEVVVRGFVDERHRPWLRKVLYLSLLDTPGSVMRAVAGRLFPSPAELTIRYDLRSGGPEIWAWYVLNFLLLPWFVLTRKSGKA